ncbi:hypothetical protein HBI56_040970 [Parastagonospora nodorum]|uniref:Uncharacterized protein n=1 Tax=Phaeosphaeria nodorum (strain SN15 / ATCC MYA-4574 / FGSC 10173) TaxID=321614 RepID=A0A7U2HZ03_PHANO|nr:hypothetical protein HBH56_065790 [Parastagonospora nodorum]QRC93297.1 hypothetical protein JI435_403570 [Parastagonospora nodorum SN15]KAH3932729.1 hypothetical protein HBH54_082300 [Parastagonospora nodorum]KAH3955031.1 hypothetical protein HBH53_012090 [Parastagonospora nodorum]KAH3986501.1 hypothetical protein HBH52_043290 [Parastagonospora nodorum]
MPPRAPESITQRNSAYRTRVHSPRHQRTRSLRQLNQKEMYALKRRSTRAASLPTKRTSATKHDMKTLPTSLIVMICNETLKAPPTGVDKSDGLDSRNVAATCMEGLRVV